jgi:hypothetical protein
MWVDVNEGAGVEGSLQILSRLANTMEKNTVPHSCHAKPCVAHVRQNHKIFRQIFSNKPCLHHFEIEKMPPLTKIYDKIF